MKSKYLILIAFLVLSCKSPEKNLYQFDPRTLKENIITLSEIADDITYIPLDNSMPMGLIYNPRYFVNNSIYLSTMNSGILVFDKKGKLIRKIGVFGRGPGEYTYCYYFTVDDKNETVYVLDSKIIKVYSKSGNFLRSFSLNENGSSFDAIEFSNSKLFLQNSIQYEDTRYEWIVLDTLGNLVKTKRRTDQPFSVNWSAGGGMYKLENRIYSWNPWRDTIFSILPDLSNEPSFLFAPWENRVPRSMITDISQFQTFNTPNSVFETNNYLLCGYTYNKKIGLALIDKKIKKSYLTYLEPGPHSYGTTLIGGIFNDFDAGVRFQPENYYEEKNREYIISLINPIDIKARVKTNEFKRSQPKYPEKKKELEQLATSLKEIDNQILMIVKLKK
jgi:hypothetical protein